MHSAPRTEKEAPENPLLAAKIFPGRQTLTCQEVAKVMAVTPRHIADLCAEGTIQAMNLSGEGNGRSLNRWRIPVAAYDAWVQAKSGPSF